MTTTATPTESTEQPKKSGRGKIVIGAVALLVLLGGGGAAYWMFAKGAPEGEGKANAKQEEKEALPTAAIPMEPFVVNLADPGGTSFFRVNLSLVAEEEEAKVFEEHPVNKAKVRSQILELLALQTSDKLVTPSGKAELKKAIAEVAHKAVPEAHISDVLFSEFVVQF